VRDNSEFSMTIRCLMLNNSEFSKDTTLPRI
jgi:hypothetical protein